MRRAVWGRGDSAQSEVKLYTRSNWQSGDEQGIIAHMEYTYDASRTGTHDSFWQALSRPIIGLAPMDGVGDHPFRHIQKKYGNPDVVYTEFTSVEALCHGDWQAMRNFLYDESQRPIIAQIYGRTPDYFRQVAIMLCELGFEDVYKRQ